MEIADEKCCLSNVWFYGQDAEYRLHKQRKKRGKILPHHNSANTNYRSGENWRIYASSIAGARCPVSASNKKTCAAGWPRRFSCEARRNYLAFISATVVSSMRFEKPHSLSYHDDTLTRRPDTLVKVESKFDEAGLWLKSIDTSGSVW